MKRIRLIFLIVPLFFLAAIVWLLPVSAEPITPTIHINPVPVVSDVKPFGLNIGAHDRFGASQILKNVIVNPGLEAGEFQMIFIAKDGPTTSSVRADNIRETWEVTEVITLGQPIGFWNDASYRVILGKKLGATGRVISFTHDDQRQTFYLSGTVPTAGDVVIVTRTMTQTIEGCCQFSSYVPDTTEQRPGSQGNQSLRATPPISPNWNAYTYYMDSHGSQDGDRTAGKLLQMRGDWLLSFWAKAEMPNKQIKVRLYRSELRNTFLDQTLQLTDTWTKIDLPVSFGESADSLADPASALVLSINTDGGPGDFWLDDFSFARVGETNPTVFSDNFVDYLKQLQPGIIRNWGDRQLGSTLDNQLADVEERQTHGWKPTEDGAHYFHFSIGEFLALAQEVGAEPWYVIPPTFTDEEMANLAAYLAAPKESEHAYANIRASQGQTETWTSVFPTIHLEFGNEIWGDGWGTDPFRGASVSGGINVGKLADARFNAFQSTAFATDNINLIIGGQTRYPTNNQRIEANSAAHDMLALSPYFGKIGAADTLSEMYYPLFADAIYQTTVPQTQTMLTTMRLLEDGTTKPAIYEINFHTTNGPASVADRNQFVTSLGGGLALPLHMLTYLRDFAIRDQVAYNMLQFSFQVENLPDDSSRTPAWFEQRAYDSNFDGRTSAQRGETNNKQFVRVWGLLRDLEATGRKRPTWLGLELINPLVHGNMIQLYSSHVPTVVVPAINGLSKPINLPLVQGFAFEEASNISVILFNLSLTETMTVALNMPAPVTGGSVELRRLSADSITANNELAENVQIQTVPLILNDSPMVTLPAHSIATFSYQCDTSPCRLVEIPTAVTLQESNLTANSLLVPISLVLLLLCAISTQALVNWRYDRLQSQR